MTRLGIIGGGQLARMMAQAADKLNIKTIVLDPSADACAGQVTRLVQAEYDDQAALKRLADQCDVLTFDFENVPADSFKSLLAHCRICPGADILETAQDRLSEKTLFRELGIAVGGFYEINSRPDLLAAIAQTGYPAVLKTRRFGYDGKGQQVLRQPEDLEHAWRRFEGHALILEQFIAFDWECSIIGVRNDDGEVHFYPLTRNHHNSGILDFSRAPIPNLDSQLQHTAQQYLQQIMGKFGYVGVLALELFVVDGQLLANEIAPRVHNSGHWTIDGAVCSQFENHVRACCGLPLGSTEANGESLMVNWIGEVPAIEKHDQINGLYWHDYGKQAREGRKVGHATLLAENSDELKRQVQQLAGLIEKQGLMEFVSAE